MTADRHALLAALDYSAKQEQEIKSLRSQLHRTHHENCELNRKLSNVKDAAGGGKDVPANYQGECNVQPMGMTPTPWAEETPY